MNDRYSQCTRIRRAERAPRLEVGFGADPELDAISAALISIGGRCSLSPAGGAIVDRLSFLAKFQLLTSEAEIGTARDF